MSDPSARLLRLLSLLQTPREWTGGELADRLAVSARTIRRDVDRLRELGYPVEATLGAAGGYRLVAGKAMPPLLLDDEEAVAIAVGLRTAAGHAVEGIEEASVRALTKLRQVLPARLRYRVGALDAATVSLLPGDGPVVDPEALTVLAAAIANHERVRFRYTASAGDATQRLVEPHRLVSAGRRWYLVGFDNERNDWRTFRVDRLHEPHATGARVAPRQLPGPDGDAARFVQQRIEGMAPGRVAEAVVHAPAERVAQSMSGLVDELEPLDEERCRLRTRAVPLEWTALRLAALGCEFEVRAPDELVLYLGALADRVGRATRDASSRGLPTRDLSTRDPSTRDPRDVSRETSRGRRGDR